MRPEVFRRRLVESYERHLRTGKLPYDMPEGGLELWSIFLQISASRTYHGAGPNPISYAEIEAYSRLHRWPLQPHHVAIIRTLDGAWLEHTYRKTSNEPERTSDGHRYAKAQPLTAQAFDAVFG